MRTISYSFATLLVLGLMLGGHPSIVEAQSVTAQVSVWDQTENNPLPEKAEVWIRGVGSWWMHQEVVQYGGDTKEVEVPLAERQNIYVYPDGREIGTEVEVAFQMTSEMCDDGCAKDVITINLTDTTVVAHGNPIEAAMGNYKEIFER